MRTRLSLCIAAAAALVAGCGGAGSGGAAPPSAAGSGSRPTGEIIVFAAASLADAFETLGQQFEAKHPGATVTFSFGPSSGLGTQIVEGAPADVFATASTSTMDAVVAADLVGSPTVFATNVMQIAVPPDNPAAISTLADLARPGVKVALCQPEAPCGALAAKVLANAGLAVTPVTLEADVKATLSKVQLGEVDAGLVYLTDVRAADAKVKGIAIPAEVNASTSYPIATLNRSQNPTLARAFVDYLLSSDGAAVLDRAGFRRPDDPMTR